MNLDNFMDTQKKGLNSTNSGNQAHLLRNIGFFILLAFFIYAKTFISPLFSTVQVTRASDLTTDNILKAINEQRSLRNLVTLNTNVLLGGAAQYKTDDMQLRHYFAHVDPDGHYIWDKIVALGYTPYLQLGENLAIEFYDTDSLVSAWMNSPTHRENLLNEGFRDQGMGLTFGDSSQGQYHSAIANTFGALAAYQQPKTVSPAPAPAPKTTAPSTLGADKTSSPTPAPSPAPTPTAAPVAPRGTQDLAISNPDANFVVPQSHATTTPSTSTVPAATTMPAEPVVGDAGQPSQTSNDINRYLILVSGGALLLLMLFDIKKVVEKKLGSLDKKINNLVILLISLIVIGFIYWL
jgi:uncharacterized protein YkwD